MLLREYFLIISRSSIFLLKALMLWVRSSISSTRMTFRLSS
jgi:hypothetical protein